MTPLRLTVLYFAWLRQTMGSGQETIEAPVATVGELLAWLAARSEAGARALANRQAIRVAVNQAYVKDDAPLSDGDEVAIFPPVTGG